MKVNLIILTLIFSCLSVSSQTKVYDVVVYGGTSSGVIAANALKRLGKSVLLIHYGKHLGGLSASGLGETDIGNKYVVTGLSRDFYRRMGKEYHRFEAWKFEPHKAEKIFNDYINEQKVEVLYNYRIVKAEKKDGRIKSITVENALQPSLQTQKLIIGKTYIDCSYEGDLMAAAKVSYFVGRESNTTYDETYSGVKGVNHDNQLPDGIDPYKIPGDSTSGLIWGIQNDKLQTNGTGDKKVQAFNYRLCLSRNPKNQIKFSRPLYYDSTQFEILRRLIKQRADLGWSQNLEQLYLRMSIMPNDKTDTNNKGGFSTDMIGESWEYAEADYQKRLQLEAKHKHYIQSLFYFLATDSIVPQHLKNQMNEWGWAKDEFLDNGNFPWQIYVREGRRMIGEYVITQHDCEKRKIVEDAIAMAAYNIDTHNSQRLVVEKNGVKMVKNEGDIQIPVNPYPISYRALVPKSNECTNLIVPVALSASQVAYGSIRMEPVFMVLGQVAAIASHLSINNNISVQDVDINKIREMLITNPLLDGSAPEIICDNSNKTDVKVIGKWELSPKTMSTYHENALILKNDSAEEAYVNFKAPKNAGFYKIHVYQPENPKKLKDFEFESTIKLRIKNAYGIDKKEINIEKNLGEWIEVGEYQLSANDYVEIYTGKSEKYVAADAVLFVPITKK